MMKKFKDAAGFENVRIVECQILVYGMAINIFLEKRHEK